MRNNQGFAEVALLLCVLGGVIAFFVPNPISSSLGIGIRPNKTVQTEKVELIKDKDGTPIAYKTTVEDKDMQQHVGLLEQLRSLPIFILVLSFLGIFSTPIALWLHNARLAVLKDTKLIVHSVNDGLNQISDPVQRQSVLDAMSKKQNTSTKKLVNDLKHT